MKLDDSRIDIQNDPWDEIGARTNRFKSDNFEVVCSVEKVYCIISGLEQSSLGRNWSRGLFQLLVVCDSCPAHSLSHSFNQYLLKARLPCTYVGTVPGAREVLSRRKPCLTSFISFIYLRYFFCFCLFFFFETEPHVALTGWCPTCFVSEVALKFLVLLFYLPSARL